MSKTKDSPAMQLLQLVWNENNRGTRFSWERLNHGMRMGVHLAIGSGMRFAPGDFHAIYQRFNAGRWIGDSEWVYTMAVQVDNISAIECIEADRKRTPIRANDCRFSRNNCGEWLHGASFERQRSRLAVGVGFRIGKEVAWVTSFVADNKVVACKYAKPYPEGKPISRLTLSQDDIKKLQKEASDA